MAQKPSYEELEQRVKELEKAELERKTTMDGLRESEEQYRSFVQNFQGIAFRGRMDFTPIFFHGATEEITGYTEREFLDGELRWDQVIHPEDLPTLLTEDEERLHSTPHYSYEREYRIMSKDGAVRWVHEAIQNICDESGKPAKVQGVIYDITDRKQTEEELSESEKRFKTLITHTTDAIFCYEYDPPIPTNLPIEEQVKQLYDCVLVECNDVCARSYGFKYSEEVIGKKLTELFGTKPNSLDKLFIELIQSDYQIIDGEGIEILEDGTKRFFLNNGHGIIEDGKLVRVWGTYRDITDRKQAEEALRESEEKYHDLYEYAPDMLTSVCAKTATILDCNQTLTNALGYTKEEIIGRTIFDMYNPDSAEYATANVFPEFAKTGTIIGEELQLQRKDGSALDVSLNVSAVLDEKGDIIRSRSAWRDITERKRAEVALEESEERLKSFYLATFEGIAISKKGKIIDFNRQFAEIFGYEHDELIGSEVMNLVAEEDRELVLNKIRSGYEKPYAHKALKKDGSIIYIEVNGQQIQFQGRPARVTAIHDLTERIRVEKALRESEDKFKSLTNNLNLGVYRNTKGSEGKFLEANPAIVEMFGFDSKEEFLNVSVSDLYRNPDDRQEYNTKLLKEGSVRNEEQRLQKKDGTLFIGSISAVAVKDQKDEVKYYDGIIEDITERKRVEEVLRESENKYRQLFSTVSDAIIIFDAETKEFVDANDAVSVVYGYSNDEFLKLRHFDITAEHEKSIESTTKLVSGGIAKIPIRYHKHKDGTIFPVEISSGKFILGNRLVHCGVIRDISDRLQAEEALMKSEEKYRNLFESSIDPVYINSRDGTFIDVNQSFLDLFGYTRKEIKNLKSQDIFANPEEWPFFMINIEKRNFIKDYNLNLKTKNGQILNCRFTANVRFEKDGSISGYQGIIRNVTEKRKAEKALLRSREDLRNLSTKLIKAQEEERRRISLELHDEMGQSLTAIEFNLAGVEEELPSDIDPGIRTRLADIHSIVSKASEQVSELSLALRPSMLDDIGLIPTLRWHFNQVGKRTSLEIKLETIDMDERLGQEIETVLFRVSQEAINNIIKHADAKHVLVRVEQKQESIDLYIKDDGKGFDEKEFLTDHQKGKIGLIGIQERVGIIGGNLSIQSRKGHGTQILVEIPVGIEDLRLAIDD